MVAWRLGGELITFRRISGISGIRGREGNELLWVKAGTGESWKEQQNRKKNARSNRLTSELC